MPALRDSLWHQFRRLTVSCTASSATMLQKASELAKKLQIPFIDGRSSGDMTLVYTNERLELRTWTSQDSRLSATGILFIDFIGGKSGYRQAHNCTINQPLARAVGIKSGFRPTVFDATAGMGGDAFVLASLGCTVTMIERSPSHRCSAAGCPRPGPGRSENSHGSLKADCLS